LKTVLSPNQNHAAVLIIFDDHSPSSAQRDRGSLLWRHLADIGTPHQGKWMFTGANQGRILVQLMGY